MRTTVEIAGDLPIELKRLAAETRSPLREVMEDAIRAELSRRREAGAGA